MGLDLGRFGLALAGGSGVAEAVSEGLLRARKLR